MSRVNLGSDEWYRNKIKEIKETSQSMTADIVKIDVKGSCVVQTTTTNKNAKVGDINLHHPGQLGTYRICFSKRANGGVWVAT